MLDLRIKVGPPVDAHRICTTYKKPSDAEVIGGLLLQERRIQAAGSLRLLGTAVTVDTSRICSSRGHHE